MKSYLYFLFILTAILSASCSTKELIPIKSSNKEIKTFSFKTLNINASIDSVQRNITANLPFRTDASLLAPTITISPKATISPASDIVQNFTKPVLYKVTAEDGSSQTFTVNISIKSSEKQITSFSFKTLNINASIDSIQRNITATLPSYSIDPSLLSPTITISAKATISPSSDIIQNFTKPVLYIVTAEDGSRQTFTVNIIAPPKSSKPTSTLVSSNFVKLQWAKIDNIKSYKIYRNNIVVYEGSNLFFEDTGLNPETTYTYNLTLVNEFGESPKSEALIVKTSTATLVDVVDDKSYASYLPFTWLYYYNGKEQWFDSYKMTFESNSSTLKLIHFYNYNYYVDISNYVTKAYSFKIEKDIIYIFDTDYKKFIKFIRIEKNSLDQFKAYSISETATSYRESLMGIFNKADYVEQNNAQVIKNSDFLDKMTGLWKEADNPNLYFPDKNIVYDFSENKNFFWKRYETYDGSKKAEKYQYKIDAQSKFFTRSWGNSIDASWKSVDIKYDAIKNSLIVDGKQWYR
jgi:hypothetical protein